MIKRFSTAIVPTAIVPLEGHPIKRVGSIGLPPSQRSRDKVFEGIDLFKTLQTAELEFTSYNMEGLMPLAHRVDITHNNAYRDQDHINSEGG